MVFQYIKLTFSSGVLATLLTACSTHYVPSQKIALKNENTHDFSGVSGISLLNAQPHKKPVKIASMGNLANPKSTVYADYNAWTEIVVQNTRELLRKQSMNVVSGSSKTLRLAIVKVHVIHGTYMGLVPVVRPACQVVLRATTGDEYEQNYDVTGKSFYAGWKSSCDEAMAKVVEALLKDKRIIAYLKQ